MPITKATALDILFEFQSANSYYFFSRKISLKRQQICKVSVKLQMVFPLVSNISVLFRRCPQNVRFRVDFEVCFTGRKGQI